jgi:hypothetical protein
MKSYFLENVSSLSEAIAFLESVLPGQDRPWILRDGEGDPIAYLHVATELDGIPNIHICVDISGRYLEKAASVRALLLRAQETCAGTIVYVP